MNTPAAAPAAKRLTHSELLQLHLKRLEGRIQILRDTMMRLDPEQKGVAITLAKLQSSIAELSEIQGWLLKEMDI